MSHGPAPQSLPVNVIDCAESKALTVDGDYIAVAIRQTEWFASPERIIPDSLRLVRPRNLTEYDPEDDANPVQDTVQLVNITDTEEDDYVVCFEREDTPIDGESDNLVYVIGLGLFDGELRYVIGAQTTVAA